MITTIRRSANTAGLGERPTHMHTSSITGIGVDTDHLNIAEPDDQLMHAPMVTIHREPTVFSR